MRPQLGRMVELVMYGERRWGVPCHKGGGGEQDGGGREGLTFIFVVVVYKTKVFTTKI